MNGKRMVVQLNLEIELKDFETYEEYQDQLKKILIEGVENIADELEEEGVPTENVTHDIELLWLRTGRSITIAEIVESKKD